MKFAAILALFAILLPSMGLACTVQVGPYPVYSVPLTLVGATFCQKQLADRGIRTLGDVPGYPYIGGANFIVPGNLRGCLTCYELTYTDRYGERRSYNFTIIDTALVEYRIEPRIFAKLAGEITQTIQATARQVAASGCGI